MIEVRYIRASTLRIAWDGRAILTDPWFARRMRGLPVFVRPCLRPEDLPPLDLVLVSHLHPDHFDRRAMARLARPARVLVGPPGIARAAAGARADEVVALADGDVLDRDGFTVRAFSVPHSGYENAYLVERGGASLLFAGDARYGDAFARIGRAHAPAIALLPVGGTLVFGRRIVMGPADALRAALDLRAKAVVPIHPGGEWMSVPPLSLHPGRARRLAERASAAGAPLTVVALAPGESARFDARGAVLSSPATTEEATA